MKKVRPWPFPGDSILDRARRVAQSYRNALTAADPALCRLLDESASEVGEGWVVPQLATVDLDDEVTVEQAAELTGRTTACIHKWINRDRRLSARKNRQGFLVVVVRDVLDVSASLRRKRAGQTQQMAS